MPLDSKQEVMQNFVLKARHQIYAVPRRRMKRYDASTLHTRQERCLELDVKGLDDSRGGLHRRAMQDANRNDNGRRSML